VGEAQLGEAGGGVRLVAEPVPSLLGRRAVVAQAVGLDHEAELGPVEVDFELVDDLAGERHRQADPGRERQEAPFELLLGEAKGAPVEDPTQLGDARLADALVERPSELRRVRQVLFVRLVDHPLDAGTVEA